MHNSPRHRRIATLGATCVAIWSVPKLALKATFEHYEQ